MANAGGTAGIGIKLLTRKDTGAQQIIGLVPGGAAKLSGMLQENDTLLKVGGKAVTGEKLDEVNKLLQGAPGSKVRLKLSRSGMQFDVTLVRADESAAKKPAAAKPVPAKAAEPAGKKKLTDRERADRLLNGGPKHWGSDHNTNMSKASDAEAARINAADAKRKSNAQEEADALYKENIRRDQEAKEAAKAKGEGTWGGLGGVFGGIVGGQEDNKRKQTEEEIRKSGGKGEGFSLSHIIPFASKDEHATKKPKTEAAAASSWNPFAAKPASPPPKPASWNPFAKAPAAPPPKESAFSALNPFARKPEKEKSWHEKISVDMKNKSNEIKASVLDAHLNYKLKKASSEIFGTKEPPDKASHAQSLCGVACCGRGRK